MPYDPADMNNEDLAREVLVAVAGLSRLSNYRRLLFTEAARRLQALEDKTKN